MDDLIADFLTETGEGLAGLDTALLRLERHPDDPRTIGEIFRLIHTIYHNTVCSMCVCITL